MDYNANDRDQIRRAYLQKTPCQPCDHNFPQKSFGQKLRQFNQAWFNEFPNWLEYSVVKDVVFCLCCYLFKLDIRDQAGGDSFVARIEYQTRLNASVDCVKFLLRQGLAFRGHDESENSSNQGNFLELIKFLADHNEYVKVVALSNAPQNLKLTSPDIQKYIVNVATFETINVIIRDLGDALFSILIDEARDISIKEQMTVVIRYVDKKGHVIERFLGYDGASNMQGEFNGLKTLILKENPCVYYVHCFAHQLQLALVAVAKNHNQISLLFTLVSIVVNVIGASCKRRDIVREKQAVKVDETLNIRELSSGQDLNQETNLKRACDTRWGSHYGTLVSLASMFSTVIDVLDMILKDGSNSEQRVEANILLDSIQSFEFVFNLHLMKMILAITSE
ncbi:zinc finger MYM-type protein 1-like [Camellia sinensis]|uniref:zinc finger MYM-type protein 1-like n=1 Tax=Camellia sinensis TaxID=4442 RepID=UPI001036E234|nr:zinc finger MYM-type protein 1-like [Camellia sinensis]